MLRLGAERKGVSNAPWITSVIVLLILAGGGFGLYLTKPSAASNTTEVMTHTEVTTHTEVMTETRMGSAIPFTPKASVMMAEGIHNAYLIVVPVGGGNWAIEIHAEGLKPTAGTGNIYLIEAQQKGGAMGIAPIHAQNATASEFSVGRDGIGQYFTTLNQDPQATFESVLVVFLGGMQMSNATVIATATP